MSRARKVDENQREIVEGARKHGYSVFVASAVGQGFPDLIVGTASENHLIEVKDGNKPPSARKLTKAQEKFHAEWIGPIHVVENLEQLLEVCK